jgi:hypothetical protein
MKKIVTTPRVDIALRTMTTEEAEIVRTWFGRLRQWETDADVQGRAHRLRVPDASGENGVVYLLKTDTDLRIFFRLSGDTIEILDVAKKASIYVSSTIP